jgi:hypothetical protein
VSFVNLSTKTASPFMAAAAARLTAPLKFLASLPRPGIFGFSESVILWLLE